MQIINHEIDSREAGVRCVLMSVDTLGGVWTQGLELAEGLAARGVEVVLAAMGAFATPAQRAAVARLRGVELIESEFKLEWMENPWLDVLAAGEWMLEIEDRVRPDVVHLNGYMHGALPWRAPVLVGAHSCVCSWFAAVRGEPAPHEWNTYRREVADGLASADLVVAPSAFMLGQLAEHYGFQGPGRVIYNGRKNGSRRRPAKEPFVFAAGRLWDEGKNILALEAAGRELPWPILVAGDPRHPDGGQVRLEHLIHVGQLAPEGVADFMGRAMVYALPALYEPFGLTVLEAALAGCALVLGDIPSLREIWGDAALYVAPRDTHALALTLDRVMRDRELREEYADRAHDRAAQFTPERMTGQYLDAYREAIERKRMQHYSAPAA